MGTYNKRNPGLEAQHVQRRTQGLEMKAHGATYQQISDALGYSGKGHAYKDLHVALDKLCKEETLSAENMRTLQNERLETLFAAVWPEAVGMNPAKPGVNLRAAEVVIRIMERQARLNGLDAPVKADVAVSENVDARIRVLLEKLGIEREPVTVQGELASAPVAAEIPAQSPDYEHDANTHGRAEEKGVHLILPVVEESPDHGDTDDEPRGDTEGDDIGPGHSSSHS
jgi:hypothetical protein